jgi:endonuclease YncB( thermonuclease family)
LTAVAFTFPAQAGDLVGSAHVHDGDTLTLGNTKVRLEGIDAPETDQLCLTSKSKIWHCGLEARDKLRAKIGMAPVTCELKGHDRYRRTLAICSANDIDLNAWLVRQGWALSFVRYGDRYRAEENEARRERRGLWAGAFIAPWDWRHRSKRTEILGAGQVPIEAQKLLVRP